MSYAELCRLYSIKIITETSKFQADPFVLNFMSRLECAIILSAEQNYNFTI